MVACTAKRTGCNETLQRSKNWRNSKALVVSIGSVCQGLVPWKGGTHFVWAEDVGHPSAMDHWFDIRRVDFIELFNVTHNMSKLRREGVHFFGRQLKPRQLGCFEHLFARKGHFVLALGACFAE